MNPENKRWQISSLITPEADEALHGYPPILRQVLFNRGYATHEAARTYLEGQQPPGTSPNNLLGIPEAVERILRAIHQKENIVIYGDYDVDGVTSVSILYQALHSLGGKVAFFIPDRMSDGYGLSIKGVDKAIKRKTSLIITVS